MSLDEERNWYRYHALFAELLKNQLMQVEPELVDDLHERAADWYQKNGFIPKAVEHAFQMSSGMKVSRLIEKYALPMIYQGEVSTVRAWFDRLPESLVQGSPMLCICKAWSLALMQRQAVRAEEIEQALRAAADALHLANANEALRNLVAGHTASIQAFSMGPRNRTTTLSNVIMDQAGLVGLIRRLHGHGIVLISIRVLGSSGNF